MSRVIRRALGLCASSALRSRLFRCPTNLSHPGTRPPGDGGVESRLEFGLGEWDLPRLVLVCVEYPPLAMICCLYMVFTA